MLLTPKASDYLLSLNVLKDINFSFDGARKATVETLRKRVKYDVLLRNVTYFINKASEIPLKFPICISMVLLKCNIHKVPQLMKLINTLQYGQVVNIHIGVHMLDFSHNIDYSTFYRLNYTDINDHDTYAFLQKSAKMGETMGIPIYYSYSALNFQSINGQIESRKKEGSRQPS